MMSNFSYSHSAFKRIVLQTHKTWLIWERVFMSVTFCFTKQSFTVLQRRLKLTIIDSHLLEESLLAPTVAFSESHELSSITMGSEDLLP